MQDRNKDLLDRTSTFSKKLITILKKLSNSPTNSILLKQTIRSGTSIGANYREACEAESSRDFVHKIRIAKKECRETCYWLDLLISSDSSYLKELSNLLNECNELLKIFSTISSKFKS